MKKFKVLVFKNRVKVEVKDDFEKAADYIKRYHNFEVEFEFRETNLKVDTKYFLTKMNREWYGITGVREQLMPLTEKNKYHCVIFAWDKMESPLSLLDQQKFALTSWSRYTPVHINTNFVELVTSPNDDKSNHIYHSIIHELYHVFRRRVNNRGANVPDVMDRMRVNGEWIDYYKNSDVEAIDGNFATQRVLLNGMDDKILYMPEEKVEEVDNIKQSEPRKVYRPKNFILEEFVSKEIFKKYGERAWQFLDERMTENVQAIRDYYGVPVTANNWKWGGQFQYRGFDAYEFRKTYVSQHHAGRACDLDVQGKTAQQVRDDIVSGRLVLPHPNVWIEDNVNWNHMDVRFSEVEGVYQFNK